MLTLVELPTQIYRSQQTPAWAEGRRTGGEWTGWMRFHYDEVEQSWRYSYPKLCVSGAAEHTDSSHSIIRQRNRSEPSKAYPRQSSTT
jgi:hypothetical protein